MTMPPPPLIAALALALVAASFALSTPLARWLVRGPAGLTLITGALVWRAGVLHQSAGCTGTLYRGAEGCGPLGPGQAMLVNAAPVTVALLATAAMIAVPALLVAAVAEILHRARR